MDPRYLPAGMTEKRGSCSTSVIRHPSSGVIPDCCYRESIHGGHFRHWIAGIHQLFISDGSPSTTCEEGERERERESSKNNSENHGKFLEVVAYLKHVKIHPTAVPINRGIRHMMKPPAHNDVFCDLHPHPSMSNKLKGAPDILSAKLPLADERSSHSAIQNQAPSRYC